MPQDSFDVLVYLLAVLSDGEKLQNAWRAFLEPCVPGVLKDCAGDILSLSLWLISSTISRRQLGLVVLSAAEVAFILFSKL